ncbi:MAG: ABC transporter ATP-binding protein [Clostridiales Family XIII bacterium]|jgi:branched-chain amino acid transport system ATP-binding protein|nr:ABC transporter ATP-binding protein [Clostridiales Family XIII bacterium]
MLEARNLKVSYGHIDAVRGITFRVEAGEIVSLIGANGAGKSTTLRAISGLIRPRAGEIVFEGKPIEKAPPHELVKLGIVHVPESRQIFGRLSVAENLALGGYRARDKHALSERLDYVFGIFPILKERYRRSSGVLSGGEQQMLAIGRALMSGPKLLLLDEPSLGLAPIYVQRVMDVISQLRDRGITILLVEQNVHEALHISDKTWLLENGRIVLFGKSGELLYNEQIRDSYLGGGI